MTLNEHQVHQVKHYFKNNGLNKRLIIEDFLDHICCMIENNMDLGYTFEDSLIKAFEKLPINEIKNIELFTLKLINMETSFSSRISTLATIPFVFWGFTWLADSSGIGIPYFISMLLFILAILSMFGLFCIGWYKDFPSWSFPAIGFCILFSLFFMGVTVPSISTVKLGFYSWLPFAISLFVSLMFKPSMEPLKKIIERIKNEPSLLLFIFYGFSPFFISLFCDEIHSARMIPVAIISTFILSFGLYIYLRSDKIKTKVISLLASGTFALALTIMASHVYWKTLT